MLEITSHQVRVLGVLLEKSITTPDQYPLSLNALVGGCNQKSNREPVMSLTECEVQSVVDSLGEKKLITEVMFGGRVPKYKQRLCNTEFSQFYFIPEELGILCVLFLRGPQTPGELRVRTNRLCDFANVQQVDSVLARLMKRDDGHFVGRLPPRAGKREVRYSHLFSGVIDVLEESPVPLAIVEQSSEQEQRIVYLEQEVNVLREEMDSLKKELGL
jgi:uncharacterized protein YceH (UPF0502 family)